MLSKEEIESLIAEHEQAPHLRALQKRLAQEVTTMVHSKEDYEKAVDASNILFGNATSESLQKLDKDTFLSVFKGVPLFQLPKSEIEAGMPILTLLAEKTNIVPSKGEARKMIQGGGVSMNKSKIESVDFQVSADAILNGSYILLQRGKKNYYIVEVK